MEKIEEKKEKPNYLEEYPDFYKEREGFLEEDKPELFVGRENLLKGYWWIVRDLMVTTTIDHNTALISMRRVGKTAFLKRFLNVVHEEQDIVLPLYYEFKLERRDIYEVADEIVFTFIKQALLFYTRKKEELRKINSLKELKEYMKEKEMLLEKEENKKEKEENKKDKEGKIYRYLYKKIKVYESDKEDTKKGEKMKRSLIEEALNMSINILDIMEVIRGKKQKAIVVIDEAQNLSEGIIDKKKYDRLEEMEEERIKKRRRRRKKEEKEIPEEVRREIEEYARINCKDAITTIINEPRMCTILSGSKPSMIANEIICDKVNRIRRKNLRLLDRREVKELVERIVEKNRDKIKKVYKRLYKDLYKLVGGNPFYIRSILIPESENEKREFRNKKDLIRIFNKEAKEEGGRIYEFWKGHFVENLKKLNGGKEEIGLGFKIMKIIGNKMEEDIKKEDKAKKKDKLNRRLLIAAEDIQEELKEVKIGGREEGEERSLKEVDERLTRLDEGDFIEYSPLGYVIKAIKDRVLPLIMDILYFDLKNLRGRERLEEEMKEKIERRLEIKKLRKKIDEIGKNISKIEDNISQIEDNIDEIGRDLEKVRDDVERNKKNLNKLKGEESNRKGLDAEELVKERINKGRWKYKDRYKIIGEAEERNIKIKNEKGEYERAQIDVEVIIEERETKEEKIMIIEVKNQNRKINRKDVNSIIEKFKKYEKAYKKKIEELKREKKEVKEREIIKVIIFKKGIFKTAQILAERNDIKIYSFEEIFGEEIIKELEEINRKEKKVKRKNKNKEKKSNKTQTQKSKNKEKKRNKKGSKKKNN